MGAHISIFHCSAFDGKNIEVTDAIINFIDEKAKASKTNLNGNLNLKQGIFFYFIGYLRLFQGWDRAIFYFYPIAECALCS